MKKFHLMRDILATLALTLASPALAQTDSDALIDLLKREAVATSHGADLDFYKETAQKQSDSPAVMRLVEFAKRAYLERHEGAESEGPLPGAITEFYVSFPFSGATLFDFAKPLSVEKGFDTSKAPEGVAYPALNWTIYQSRGNASALRLREAMAQSDFQTVYLATRIVIDAKQPLSADLEIPSSGPIIAWMNGKRVAQNLSNGASPAPLFGDRWPVELNPGENILVLKVGMLEEIPHAYVFLSDSKTGRPIALTIDIVDKPIVSNALDGNTPENPRPSLLRQILERDTASVANRAIAARRILEENLANQKISDLLFSNLDATAQMSPDDLEVAILALNSPSKSLQILNRVMKKYAGDPRMELIDARQKLLATDEQGDSGTRFIDDWIELESKLQNLQAPTVHEISYEPLRLKMLVLAALKQNLLFNALEMLHHEAQNCENCVSSIAPMLIGELHDARQFAIYAKLIQKLQKTHQNDPSLRVENFRLALKNCQSYEELAALLVKIRDDCKRYLATHSDNDYVYNFWIDIVEHYGRDSKRASDHEDYRVALENAGFTDTAGEWFLAYLYDRINDESRWQRYANYCQRTGQTAELMSAYKILSDMNPQNESIKERITALRTLSGDSQNDELDRKFETDYIVQEIPESRDPSATGVVSLLNNRVVRIVKNGLSAAFSQLAFQIMDEQGIKQLRQMPIFYDPNEEDVEIISVTTRKKDGTMRHLYKRYEQDMADESIRMYYSEKLIWIEIQDLDVGDIVEYRFKKKQTQRATSHVTYFNDVYALQAQMNRQWSRYTLIAPTSMPVHLYVSNPKQIDGIPAIETREVDDVRIQTLDVRDITRIIPESNMPGATEIMPTLLVSTFDSWQDLVNWFLDLASPQWIADDAIRAKVRELTDGVSDPLEKVKRIHSFVVKSTRYVALEFGIHGHKPYPVPQIFERRFGDCKDKASLLKVMLREAGIASSFVLLRTRTNGDVTTKLASPGLFDHAILYIPQFDMFLDGTAEFSGTRELPTMDQDALALIMQDDGSFVLRKIPPSTAEENVVRQKSKFTLTGDEALWHLDITLSGMYAAGYRSRYQVESLRRERLEAELSQSYAGTHVDDYHFSELDDLEKDVHFAVDAHIAFSDVVKVQGNTWIVYPLMNPGTMVQSFAPTAKRTMPLVLPAPFSQHREVTIELPADAQVVLPTPTTEESPFGSYALSSRREGNQLISTADFTLHQLKIEPESYSDYLDFLHRYDQWLSTQLKIEILP